MSINIPAGKAASETEEAAEELGCPIMVFLGGSKNPFEAGLFEIIPLLVFIGLKNKTLYITHHLLLVYIYTMSIKILNYTLCVQVQLQYEVNFSSDLKKSTFTTRQWILVPFFQGKKKPLAPLCGVMLISEQNPYFYPTIT